MSLFRRVTRYRIGPAQDPRENRLTEVTAAVLGRVDGLALDVMDVVLETAAATADAHPIDENDEAECVLWKEVRDRLHNQLDRLRELARPRLRVDTQVSTAL